MAFEPVAHLGDFLYELWDAERSDLITIATGVSAWNGSKLGLSLVQGTGANQPTYSATSFAGAAGLTFDGTNDTLLYTLSGELPASAVPGEIWALVSQDVEVGTAGAKTIVSYGDTGNLGRRALIRNVVSSNKNVIQAIVGTGAANPVATSSDGFNGRNFIRARVGPTNSQIALNNFRFSGGNIITPATTATRLRVGANSNSSADGFWTGQIALVAFTKLLYPTLAEQFSKYLLRRIRK